MTTFELKSINEIGVDAHFFIPSYQRGYRWYETQVLNLLDDLHGFMENSSNEDFYCLQPVVVRNIGEERFEVIDGQQRLTTIAILLRSLKQPAYQITYESRPDSQDMLERIDYYATQSASNVDHHYFKDAYVTIQTWIKENSRKNMSLSMKLFITLAERVKVIWYEVDQSANAYDLFLKLNVGKIQLTSAELIKAVLLQPCSEHERIELSLEWEAMERRLQDDWFWYFLESKQMYENRIEWLFDVLVENLDKHHDRYYTFYQVLNRPTFWQEVRDLYARLNEWYEDRSIYHFIGYLTHTSKRKQKVPELLNLYHSENVESKTDFIKALRGIVRKTLPEDLDELNEFDYESDKDAIKQVLLLFNLAEEMQTDHGSSRFPFHYYKQEKWSLEHIHAQNTAELTSKEQWDAWLHETERLLGNHKLFDDQKLTRELLAHDYSKREFFMFVSKLEERIISRNGESLILNRDRLHNIGNLALLSQSLNSSLSNHYYPIKFDALKTFERNGGYLPAATRKAFWKYYTNKPTTYEFWTSEDQEAYVNQIIQSIHTFTEEETPHAYA